MSISSQQLQDASRIFFQLLNQKTLSIHDPVISPYFEEDGDGVREALKILADESGTRILQTAERIHLVARPEGSLFATSFSQMKKRYGDIENKKYFYLINQIIFVFLAEIDLPSSATVRWEHAGVSYFLLEKNVSQLLSQWKKEDQETEGKFSESYGLAVKEMAELWESMAVHSDQDDQDDRIIGTRKSHIGVIHIAMRLLRDEGLVFIVEDEKRAIPKKELYERLENGYHQQARYEEMRELILASRRDAHA
ncbi:DUF6063 family protein [Pullulanibacillus sp. KACC 23026]|uniref:DUF6063 family protein n=1 Tax=Pullulanibacillus sp. KACC 23026 TaxID=3028315 RepID=UPI0023AFACA6|nr:DUF6063 family protein [Pullulanibacillus sp. KACC 23026]WEG11165.1 DUF6063 family protein [Pullulanibacillus sp. KACC 23026]